MWNRVKPEKCTTSEMVKYSLGACSESLIMNSFFGFAMLYYTKPLGLSPEYAAWAAFVAGIWDAVTDPVMGHISDNTRSRFGKRYPYMVFGGISMVISFFFIWYVPDFFKSGMILLFWYLVVMNLLLRTTFTVFIVPYTALSFEICSDYTDRSKIQGIRSAMNMAANLLGPALAHMLFFSKDTEAVRANCVAQNYVNMGMVFTIASVVFIGLMLFYTRKYISDSRHDNIHGNKLMAFIRDFRGIVFDKYPRWVFLFIFFVLLGVVMVSNLQMYVFEDFMQFSGQQKSIAHGATMVGMALGSLFGPILVRHFDKKGSICIGVIWSVFCDGILGLCFLTSILSPGQTLGKIPLAFLIFSFFHGAYWFGNGVMIPISISMMADVSEIHRLQSGINKDGSYAAMYSLATKASISLGLLISGYCLAWVGFKSGSEAIQTVDVSWRICALTLVAGPSISLIALMLILKYPVNKMFLEMMRNIHEQNNLDTESIKI